MDVITCMMLREDIIQNNSICKDIDINVSYYEYIYIYLEYL